MSVGDDKYENTEFFCLLPIKLSKEPKKTINKKTGH